MEGAERLGAVMSDENLAEVNRLLDESKLPIIPYDPSLHEMQLLLTYHGNRLAYLLSNNELISANIREQKTTCDALYQAAYKSARERNSDLKATDLKMIAGQNKEYLAAQQELLNLQNVQAVMQAEIAGLQEQNICLRKAATLQTLAIERGLQ